MALVVDGGGLVNKGGALGTGAACCCGGGGGCDCSSAGFAPAIPSDAERGLVWREFSACIGSGAEGTVDAPQAAGPCDYEGISGAITGETLTDGGSGYAVLGRVEPTVTASVTGGSGATLSVTLTEGADFLGDTLCLEVPIWSVASVSVTSGGSGYSDKQAVTFSAAAGDTVAEHAKAYAYVAIEAPRSAVVTVHTSGGSGAVLVPTFAVVSGFSINRGGAANPPFCNVPNRTAYEVTGITITNGGSGYAVDDFVGISFANSSDGSVYEQLNAEVTAVTGGGEISAIALTYGGGYGGGFTDTLESVVVEGCISGGVGKYYREDPDEPPYVAAVTVTIQQEAPSTGSGAVITATVEDDTASADFGKVVSLTLQDGGTGYIKRSTCAMPDKLYVDWNGQSFEVPIKESASVVVCSNNPMIDGETCSYGENGDGGAGYNGSVAIGTIYPPSCKCEGKLHISIELFFVCLECLGEIYRPNFYSYRFACARFDTDENGCPVGDAVVFSWSGPTERGIGFQCMGPQPYCGGCRPYYAPDGTFYPSDPCPCDSTCDAIFAPTISLMPL